VRVEFKAIMGAQANAAAGNKAGNKGNAQGAAAVDFDALLARLKEEACKTPEERARDAVLRKHDLSDEGYRALPRDKRDEIDLEIAMAVRRVAEQRRAAMVARNGAAV